MDEELPSLGKGVSFRTARSSGRFGRCGLVWPFSVRCDRL